jgi:type IV pilus assembly protein PilA
MNKGSNTVQLIHSLKSRRDEEEGFTLIELMVVVLIIAILIAIAIPTFLGARQRAQDRAAQSDLRNALTAEKTYYTDGESFTADTTSLTNIEPSLQWNVSVDKGPMVTVDAAFNQVCLERKSKSGTTFALADIATGTGTAGTYYNKGACAATVTGWPKTGW